jgi:hypothetical protein
VQIPRPPKTDRWAASSIRSGGEGVERPFTDASHCSTKTRAVNARKRSRKEPQTAGRRRARADFWFALNYTVKRPGLKMRHLVERSVSHIVIPIWPVGPAGRDITKRKTAIQQRPFRELAVAISANARTLRSPKRRLDTQSRFRASYSDKWETMNAGGRGARAASSGM